MATSMAFRMGSPCHQLTMHQATGWPARLAVRALWYMPSIRALKGYIVLSRFIGLFFSVAIVLIFKAEYGPGRLTGRVLVAGKDLVAQLHPAAHYFHTYLLWFNAD